MCSPGTRLVEEFTRDGKLVEILIIERVVVRGGGDGVLDEDPRADQEPGWVTTVNVPACNPAGLDRIDPTVPINSAVVTRPGVRGAGQRPKNATSEVDTAGWRT